MKNNILYNFYQKFLFKKPLVALMFIVGTILAFGTFSKQLEIDASAESLLLNNDMDLAFSRLISQRFETDDLLIIAYKPKTDMFSDESIQTLSSITKELEKLEMTKSVNTVLNVPLFLSPTREMVDLINKTYTYLSKDTDKELAKKEFLQNPLYKDSLVNKDLSVSAIVINLKEDSKYNELLNTRNTSSKTKTINGFSEYEIASKAFKNYRDNARKKNEENIDAIRSIILKHKDNATFFLGGVQMISNDIVSFVKSDLVIYGSALVTIIILMLAFLFRKIRWIVLPILICTLSVIAITSSLGFFGWEITVISSNFIALQLIITISIVIHLIIRHEELLSLYPRASYNKIILLTMLSKISPTFFAIATTIAGFSSLIFSYIYPVINLGWMMSLGILMSFAIAFLVFPLFLLLLPKKKSLDLNKKPSLLSKISSNIVLNDKILILSTTFFLIVFSVTGAYQLIVENSFINYFKKDTEIYKGMKVIDTDLGGTTPLDVIITLNDTPNKHDEAVNTILDEDTDVEFDDFEEEFIKEGDGDSYWFSQHKLNVIDDVHYYLSSLKEIGEVKSFQTLLELGQALNKNKRLEVVDLTILYKELPDKYREIILSPYLNIEHNQLRFSTRIVDSNDDLRRNHLLNKIKTDLSKIVPKEIGTPQLSNLMVLYNNMLQSLFQSQIVMIGMVIFIIFLMFLGLFKSITLTSIALIVNIIPISMIFGIMGWVQIPLDIMTITIAAIAMGIGIDDTIHYIHRFKVEYHKNNSYEESIKNTVNSIGNAIYITSLIVVIGFSILMTSNLLPTIYFGLLTMLVMVAALVSNLILLPRLLMIFKPLKTHTTNGISNE